ncbi:MAG: ATP-binding protein [Candidatus Eisenbacteria bacterium]|uniref:ATP-binding protein n=1 Tax=Eiseniibacteriota bacterium TaxID=2212470 RepID=A0A933W794_UNCEI|nr:ATP-binding protein [Candidatus Eisenbacteria bacterium]
MTEPTPLTLEISLDTLRHLGMNLYSSLPPVISELVANAYDARARRVDITVADDHVVIQDDGIGMDRGDAQSKYLRVGRDRREEDPAPTADADPFPEWPRREAPMGRKGIGKLAMFSVANEVELISNKRGQAVGMKMSRESIEEKSKAQLKYSPDDLDVPDGFPQGTRITLRRLRRVRAISAERVLKAIARHFSVIDMDAAGGKGPNDFAVYVNGERVTVDHWDVFKRLQFMWHLGPESMSYAARCAAGCKTFQLDDEVKFADGTSARVTGWIGTVAQPEQLKTKVGEVDINDNRIVVDCRGKVAIANFLHHFGEAGLYAAYLAGYIRADFLDATAEDIATSDRERMKEDDPRMVALGKYVWEQLKIIQEKWRKLRREAAVEDSTKDPAIGPIVSEWLEGLTDDETADARHLIGRLSGARFSNDADKAQVLKFGILAFERLRVQHKLHMLRDSPDDQLETIAAMFALESDLENALYADIASQRLLVVQELEKLVDADAKERTIQKHIFEHLWLLEPSWTLQDQINKRLEERVNTEFEGVSLPKAQKEGRLDIRYRRAGGIHIIVELKRPGVKSDVYELLKQVSKYRDALKKCLREVEDNADPNIQCVCLVGKRPDIGPDERRVLQAHGTEIYTYDEVIADSCNRFADYLKAQKKFSRVRNILAKLDGVKGTDEDADPVEAPAKSRPAIAKAPKGTPPPGHAAIARAAAPRRKPPRKKPRKKR